MTTDQKVLGLNPNAVTQQQQGFQEIEALVNFSHSDTIPTQTQFKGLFPIHKKNLNK
jgi:hypothetical protein